MRWQVDGVAGLNCTQRPGTTRGVFTQEELGLESVREGTTVLCLVLPYPAAPAREIIAPVLAAGRRFSGPPHARPVGSSPRDSFGRGRRPQNIPSCNS
jgi:hypothetical protein